MSEAAYAEGGIDLVVNSAFRTFAEQTRLYTLWVTGQGNRAAKPGSSRHESGLAVDIESAGGTNGSYAWLAQNAARFGFKRTVSDEPWHWEFAA
jgi:D-alanyl-D-alanine carboxypeptidase